MKLTKLHDFSFLLTFRHQLFNFIYVAIHRPQIIGPHTPHLALFVYLCKIHLDLMLDREDIAHTDPFRWTNV